MAEVESTQSEAAQARMRAAMGLTQEQLDSMFRALARSLALHPLPTSDGTARTVPADEFMLMGFTRDAIQFKHRGTRAYLTLVVRPFVAALTTGTFLTQRGELLTTAGATYDDCGSKGA